MDFTCIQVCVQRLFIVPFLHHFEKVKKLSTKVVVTIRYVQDNEKERVFVNLLDLGVD